MTDLKSFYIMSFRTATKIAEQLLADGYDIEIRRTGPDSARVFAVRKKRIRRQDDIELSSDRN